MFSSLKSKCTWCSKTCCKGMDAVSIRWLLQSDTFEMHTGLGFLRWCHGKRLWAEEEKDKENYTFLSGRQRPSLWAFASKSNVITHFLFHPEYQTVKQSTEQPHPSTLTLQTFPRATANPFLHFYMEIALIFLTNVTVRNHQTEMSSHSAPSYKVHS